MNLHERILRDMNLSFTREQRDFMQEVYDFENENILVRFQEGNTQEYDYLLILDNPPFAHSPSALAEFLKKQGMHDCMIGKETDNYGCLFFQKEKIRCRLEYIPF